MDVPAGVTLEEGHTGFLHLFSEVLALIFLEKDSAIYFPRRPSSRILCTNDLIVLHLLGIYIYFLSGEIPVRATTPRFELTSQRQTVSRLSTEPPGRPATSRLSSHLHSPKYQVCY